MNHDTFRRSLHPLILCTLTVWSCSYARVSLAEEPEFQTRSKIVWFGDLNLSNPEGVAALYRRIKAAAYRLCVNPNTHTRQNWSTAESECRREAVAKAVDGLHNDRLTALHRQEAERRYG